MSVSKGLFFPRYNLENDNQRTRNLIQKEKHNEKIILPNQSTCNELQIIFPKTANLNKDYYTGWYLETKKGDIRKIIEYTGSNRIATLDNMLIDGKSKDDEIFLYKNSNSVLYFDEHSNRFLLGYTPSEKFIEEYQDDIELTNLELSNLVLHDNLILKGGVLNINNTTENSIYTEGGATIQKNLYVGQNIILSKQDDIQLQEQVADLHIVKEEPVSILLKSEQSSQIEFSNNSQFNFILKSNKNNFQLLKNNEPLLNISENGRLSLGTLYSDSLLTFAKNNSISLDDNNGYLKIIGGQNNQEKDNSNIILYGEDSEYNPSSIELNALNSILINTTDFKVNNNILVVQKEKVEINSVLEINEDTNINGTLSVLGDISVNGKVFSNNTKNISDVSTKTLVNCKLLEITNCNIIELNDQLLLTFYISVIPENYEKYASIDFELPLKEIQNKSKKDVIFHLSGWTEENELNNIYNIIGIAKENTLNAKIQFQPNSLEVHNISVWCRYTK